MRSILRRLQYRSRRASDTRNTYTETRMSDDSFALANVGSVIVRHALAGRPIVERSGRRGADSPASQRV